MTEDQDRITQIFAPEMLRSIKRARDEKIRFVHYTSAESGMKILDSGEMLLRTSRLMNDFSEVAYGYSCLNQILVGELGERLKKSLSTIQEGLPDIFSQNFGNTHHDIFHQTYLLSVSEHLDNEDRFGRLSMWRAYAPDNGVAFVLNSAPFTSDSNALNAFTVPVLYKTADTLKPYVEEIVAGIEQNLDFLKKFGGQFIHDVLTASLRTIIQTTKHPAFAEELEWRVIYTPTMIPEENRFQDQEMRVPRRMLTIRGVPQQAYSIPFKDHPDDGLEGATIPMILDRILIGPSRDAQPIAFAFANKLRTDYGIGSPNIVLTDIPMRT